MKYLIKHPEKFRKKSKVPHCVSPKTKSAKLTSCENDLYVEIEEHKDFFNQNPVVMIARIFNMFPVPVNMIEDKKKFICKVKEIVSKHQYYDMNEFFACKFEL
jgi:2-oxoglutarate dehydrogenase complex dehydrogenase (E1) component-like enzyme